jgi:hypothetical protein
VLAIIAVTKMKKSLSKEQAQISVKSTEGITSGA